MMPLFSGIALVIMLVISAQAQGKDINIVYLATAPASTPFSSPPGPAPAPAPHYVNVSNVLEQAGQFKTFLSLIAGTQVETQLQTQANNTQQGLTLFAPSDSAFSSLRPQYKVMLRKLTDEQKTTLVEYHAVPMFYSLGQFQSLSGPISTMGSYKFNVSAFGAQVNVSTGLVNAPLTSSIFSQAPVAVYEVNKVLLPEEIFGLPIPTPAPSPTPVSAPTPALSPSDGLQSPLSSSDHTNAAAHTWHLNAKGLVIQSGVAMFGFLFLLLNQ